MKRILFSNPPWWASGEQKGDNQFVLRQGRRAGSRWPFTMNAHYAPDDYRAGGYYPFPFFMGYAASYVQKAIPLANVAFRDSIARGESYQTYRDFLEAFKPDFIFIESATSAWEHDKQIIALLKEWAPGAKIVLAGPISETNAEQLFAVGVVACIKGEYEKGAVRVITGERGIIPHDLLTTEEMNSAPIPAMDDGCWDHYWDANPVGQVQPHLQLWASRGCPFKCCFCVWPAVMTGNDPTGSAARSVRFYSAEYIENYLQEMLKRYPYKSIYFDDDTFNLSDKHTREICAVMRKISLPWSAMCRADMSSREVWQEMKDSGCFGVKLGFESGSQTVIDTIINKKLDLREAAETTKFLRSIGLTVHGTFTIGLPGETEAQREETYAFIKSLPLNSYQLSGTAEIEGTPLANMKQGEALKAYPGAVKDSSYEANPDGVMKAEHLKK